MRKLRNRTLRLILYEAAGGRCQVCGRRLKADWEADHILPWTKTHRTNVVEMQALCAKCNKQKGAGGARSR